MNDTFDGPFSLVQMFWGNIAARPLRCALSVIAIAIQVILVLMIVGLTSGVISEWGKRVEGVGADILVQPPNSSIFFAFSSAVMPESLGDQIGALPGVDEVAPTVILTEPKNALVRQYQKLFDMENVHLKFTPGALRAIAREALKRKSGARGLRAIMESIMVDLMYEIPSQPNIKEVMISEEVVTQKEQPLLVYQKTAETA